LNDIVIIQYSLFGFVIKYEIYYKKKILFDFDEHLLSDNKNRNTMNMLILSKENKSMYNNFILALVW